MAGRPKGSKNKTPAEKKPKAEKAPKTPKPPKATKTAQKRFNSPVNDEDKALFLQALPKVAALKAALETANSNLRNCYKTARKDGLLKSDFDMAFMIQGFEGERVKKAAIARDLTIAKWLGADLGAQLDMFLEDERVPAADRAYEEGQTDSMQGKSAKPSYDPSTEQHRQYLAGFHDDTARRTKTGITKPKAPKPDTAARDETPAPQREKPSDPSSGVPMTRADFKRMQAEQDERVTIPPTTGAPLFKRKTQ